MVKTIGYMVKGKSSRKNNYSNMYKVSCRIDRIKTTDWVDTNKVVFEKPEELKKKVGKYTHISTFVTSMSLFSGLVISFIIVDYIVRHDFLLIVGVLLAIILFMALIYIVPFMTMDYFKQRKRIDDLEKRLPKEK